MKKSYINTIGFILLFTLSVCSLFYLSSQSTDGQQAESALEMVQASASQLNNAGEQFHKVAGTLQRLLAY